MTDPNIKKIASILKENSDSIYAHVRYNAAHKTWEVWIKTEPAEVNFKNHGEAEDRAETLNFEYAARKVWEGLVKELGMV